MITTLSAARTAREGQSAAGNSVEAGLGGDGGGDGRGDPLVELARDDVLRRGGVADQRGAGVRGRQLHVLRDRGRVDVEGGAEDAGEGERVVDLVGEVAAPGGDHGGVPPGDLRMDLRLGV